MAARVESVPNPGFSVAPLVTSSSSIVSRRRVKIPCNFPTKYSHRQQSAHPYVVQFDLSDAENFFDTDSLRFSFDFTPEFYTQVSQFHGIGSTTLHQGSTHYARGPTVELNDNLYQYMARYSPRLDGGVSALVARVRIGNAQGLVIEENIEYNLWSNVMSKYSADKEVYANDVSNYTRDSSKSTSFQSGSTRLNIDKDQLLSFGTHPRRVLMELKNISIFSKIKYFPLFLFRSALRIEIEFEDPRLAFYEDNMKVIGDVKQQRLCLPYAGNANLAAAINPFVHGERVTVWSKEMHEFGTAAHNSVVINANAKTLPLHICHDIVPDGYSSSHTIVALTHNAVLTQAGGTLQLDAADGGLVNRFSVGHQVALYEAGNDTIRAAGFITAINAGTRTLTVGGYLGADNANIRAVAIIVGNNPLQNLQVFSAGQLRFEDALNNQDLVTNAFAQIRSTTVTFDKLVGRTNSRIAFNYVEWHQVNGYRQTPSMFVFGDYKQYSIATHVAIELTDGRKLVYEITYSDITSYWSNFYLRPTKAQSFVGTGANQVGTVALGNIGPVNQCMFPWYNPVHTHVPANTARFGNTGGYRADYFYADMQVLSVSFMYDPYARYETSVAVDNLGNQTATTVSKRWSYSIENCEMLMDFVKPSSEVMVQYINQYNADAGIPYTYNRIFYHTKAVDNGNSNAPLQISLPFSVRSLKGIIVAITDNLSTYSGSDSTIYKFPSLSSFQMRGLMEAQLVVGAQQFPAYQLRFNRDFFQSEHLPELEVLFNAHFATSNPRLEAMEIVKHQKNYGEYGLHGVNATAVGSTRVYTDMKYDDPSSYWDTDGFLLGFSTVKVDGDFASGIDTTAAGSVTLNLHFDTHSLPVKRLIHVFGIADSVFTLQKDASLVRY